MAKNSKSYVSLEARNIRYLFIVDSRTPIDDLLEFLEYSQKHWGGRYNPILPSYNGKIPDAYLRLGALFDPDYVIYPDGVELQDIKKHFNPIKFIKANFVTGFQWEGVYASYLLGERDDDTVLIQNYLYKTLPNLFPFYNLNFGFLDGSEEFIGRFKSINVEDNPDKLDDYISQHSVLITSFLSKRNVKRPIIDFPIDNKDKFELIVADDNNQFEDLIYYWNRQLYMEHGTHFTHQIYITKKQVDEFLLRKPEPHFFSRFSGRQYFNICSLSLKPHELIEVKDKLNKWQHPVEFLIKKIQDFPFKWNIYSQYNKEYNEPSKRQSLMGKEDLIHLPDLTFASRNGLFGKWMVDISIERAKESENKQVLLPKSTDFKNLFSQTEGRINKESCISLLVDVKDRHLDFKISSDEKILKSLIYRKHITPKSNISLLRTSDDGMKLNSLFKLFRFNYENIEKYFEDKFWLSIFSSKSILKHDNRMHSCKGVVNYLDLLSEYKNMFNVEGYENERNFNLIINSDNELKKNLKELVDLGLFFIGNKIKCENCSSPLWYSLAELSNSIPCKGCANKINVPIESLVHYKMNDVIKNNLNSGKEKNPHGNLTVIYTLLSLKRRSRDNFYFLPQQNFYVDSSPTHRSDIDIICVSDGKLIIGEAKNNVSEFVRKEINNLIFLGNQIEPNEIILAFNDGEESKLANCVDKIKKGLINKDILVTPLKISEPYFKSRNLKVAEKMENSKVAENLMYISYE